MGEAERAARQRDREAAARKAAAKDEADRQFLLKYRAELAQVETLIPEVLAVLKAKGWPDSKMILVSRRGRGPKPRACWPVGICHTHMHNEPGIDTVYLLSTGQLTRGQCLPISPQEMLRSSSVEGVAHGLQQLLETYRRRA